MSVARQTPVELPVPPAPGSDQHPSLLLANSRVILPPGREADALATPSAAGAWLLAQGLLVDGEQLRDVCTSRLVELRVHVRELFAAVLAERAPDPQAVEALNEAMRLTSTTRPLAWDPELRLHRSATHPVTIAVERALAVYAADAAELLTGPQADRLAACEAPSCIRYLVRTHARRHWCSTRCGDRVRAARAYARRRPA